MANQTWKVQLFVAYAKSAKLADTFGVEASGHDDARRAARAWLEGRGHRVRSINFSTAAERQLIAYVAPKEG